MGTKVEKQIELNVPVRTAYNQWTQFEDFPHFMGGVESVTQLSDDRLKWVARIAGVRREWEAKILEQIPDRKVAWASIEGATNAGAVEFEEAGGGRTTLRLTMEYQPEGAVEKIGDMLHVVERQAEADLKKFKEFIEDEGYETGAWRGTVHHGAVDPSGGETAGMAGGTDASWSETDRFARPFDQTGGLVDVEGESDETAEGDLRSAAEQNEGRGPGYIPPMGGGAGQH